MQRRKKLIKKTKMKFRNSQDTLLKMLTTTTTTNTERGQSVWL